jgi:excisionase family DNA binding protein
VKTAPGCSEAAALSLGAAPNGLCSPHEAAKRTGVRPSTIHRWVESGRIAAVKASAETRLRYPGAILVDVADVVGVAERKRRTVSARRAGELLGVVETTVAWYVDHGYLAASRIGNGNHMIDVDELDAFKAWRDTQPRLGTTQRALSRTVLEIAERPCRRESCNHWFRPTATQVKQGYGHYCSQRHYMLAWIPELRRLRPKARQKWFGIDRATKPRKRGYDADKREHADRMLTAGATIRRTVLATGLSKHQVEDRKAELQAAEKLSP